MKNENKHAAKKSVDLINMQFINQQADIDNLVAQMFIKNNEVISKFTREQSKKVERLSRELNQLKTGGQQGMQQESAESKF